MQQRNFLEFHQARSKFGAQLSAITLNTSKSAGWLNIVRKTLSIFLIEEPWRATMDYKKFSSYEEAMQFLGMPLPTQKLSHSKFVRWGRNSRYWAILVGDGVCFGDHGGEKSSWFPKGNNKLLMVEINALRQESARKQKENELKQAVGYEKASIEANSIWAKCSLNFTRGTHPYLVKKQIGSHHARFDGHQLVIPVHDVNSKIWSLQYISGNGDKRFFTGGKKRGCFSVISGQIDYTKPIFIAEGFATAVTIYEVMKGQCMTITAFDAGNIEPVVANIRKAHPEANIVICGDNDQYGEENTGKMKAEFAAVKYGCKVALPSFDCIGGKDE